MRKKLFEELFEVAKKRSPSKTRNGICTYLERAFEEMTNYSFGKETFIRYHKKYIEEKNITYNPNAELLNRCAQYLKYENYEDYVMKNNNEIKNEENDSIIKKHRSIKEGNVKDNKFIFWFKKNLKIILLIILIVLISIILLSKNRERWMTWKDYEYTEARFNISQYYNGELIPYDQNKIDSFKEIENPDCETQYFNVLGEPILWYYKVGRGNLEIFTTHGYHPIHRKPLRPITRHMIQEHICSEY